MSTKSIWKRFIIYFAVILAILSCQLPSNLLGGRGEEEPLDSLPEIAIVAPPETPPTMPAVPTEPSLPTPTGTATPDPILSLPAHVQEALSWEVEFFDDFSDESQGWILGKFSNDNFVMNRGINNGQYLLTKQQIQGEGMQMFGVFPNVMILADFQISVKAGLVEGYAETGYGVGFRESMQGSYQFTVKGNAYLLSSELRQGGANLTDILINWTPSSAIMPGAMNELSVITNGDQITLMINDEIVADITDTTHSFGTLSLFNDMRVGGEQATVAFDDFVLKTRAATIFKDASTWPVDEQNLFVTYEGDWNTGNIVNEFFDSRISLTNGQYQVEATAKQGFYQVFYPEGMDELETAYISVNISVGDNSENASSGLIVRHGDEGYLTFGYHYDDDFSSLSISMFYEGEWIKLADQFINPDLGGKKEIRLGAITQGDHVVFLVDDVVYAEIVETRLLSGRTGIGVELSAAGERGSWTFTNFNLYLPGTEDSTVQTEQPTPTAQKQQTPTGGAASVGEQSVNPKDGANIVYVPAGDFLMGYAGATAKEDEGPEHLVYLDGYWLYETPVTNSQYRKCIQDESCTGTLSRFSDDTYPVVRIDWNQAVVYCEYAGGRLPTEAEWEKGARGTDGRLFPWGEQAPTCLLANYQGCFGNQVTRVGQFPDGLSPYGVLDMLGTVWEWVSDWYDEDYYTYSPKSNPIGPSEGEFRVQRGHSFESNIIYLRVTDRGRSNPSNEDYRKGFRCVIPDLP